MYTFCYSGIYVDIYVLGLLKLIQFKSYNIIIGVKQILRIFGFEFVAFKQMDNIKSEYILRIAVGSL